MREDVGFISLMNMHYQKYVYAATNIYPNTLVFNLEMKSMDSKSFILM